MAVDNYGPSIAGGTIFFLVLTTIAAGLRIYTRVCIVRSFALDDWLAVFAQILFMVYCPYVLVGIHYGTGRHMADLTQENTVKAMQKWWTCEPLYVLSTMAIKASIAVFLLRICVSRVSRVVVYVCLVATEIYGLFFFLLFILQCRPTRLFWLQFGTNPPEGYCLSPSVVVGAVYGYSGISCVTDWTFSILPIFLVWNLNMSTRIKISVILLLAAGAIASVATIVRFPYIKTFLNVSDFLYATSPVAVWSVVETGLGITTANLATLRPLLRSVLGSTGASDPSGQPYIRKTGGSLGPRTIGGSGMGAYIETGDGDKRGDNFGLKEHPRHKTKMGADDAGSDEDPFASSLDGVAAWGSGGNTHSGSKSDLEDGLGGGFETPSGNIRVQNTIVQTHSTQLK